MIYKDVFVVSFSFLLLFLAFNSTFRLQSSIHTEGNLGLWSKVFFTQPPTELLQLVGFIQWNKDFYLVASVTSEHVAVGGARWSSIVNIVNIINITNIASVTFFLKVTVYASLILSCLLLAPFMISCLRWGCCWYWWWWWLCRPMYAMTMAVTN